MCKDLFNELVESVTQMKAIQAGHLRPSRVTRAEDLVRTATPDVPTLRARFKLSQAKFATLLGISVDTLQNWEQNRGLDVRALPTTLCGPCRYQQERDPRV